MVLEHLFSRNIVKGKKILLPLDGNLCYSLKAGHVRFSKYNPTLPEDITAIPDEAVSVSFQDYEFYQDVHGSQIYYGEPTFYDIEGKVLIQK